MTLIMAQWYMLRMTQAEHDANMDKFYARHHAIDRDWNERNFNDCRRSKNS